MTRDSEDRKTLAMRLFVDQISQLRPEHAAKHAANEMAEVRDLAQGCLKVADIFLEEAVKLDHKSLGLIREDFKS